MSQQPKGGTGCQHGNPFPKIRVAYGGANVDTSWIIYETIYMKHHVCQQWILPWYLAPFGAYIFRIVWCLDICNHLGHDSFNPKQLLFSIDFPPAKPSWSHMTFRNHDCTRHPGLLGLVPKKKGLDEEGHNLGVFHIGFPRLPKGVVFLPINICCCRTHACLPH